MIVTRTPLRISFFGGGTDYPVWYNEHGGSVLNATINKYCYIYCRYLPPFFAYRYLVRYLLREEAKRIDDIKHPSVRECLKFMKMREGIEMVHTADIPARSGVGSSSAFTVGFLNALHALKGNMVTKRELARNAIYVEQHLIKENVGSQDQIAASFGGLNKIDFRDKEDFLVTPVTITKENRDALQDSLMIFFTGFSRTASDIAAEQIKNTHLKNKELCIMQQMVDDAIAILNTKAARIREFGKLLHESWKLKKSLTRLISSSEIDHIYDVGLRAGAVGGKLLGAGGGGFIMFFAPPEKHDAIKEKLKKILYVPFRFEDLGSQVILYAPQDFK